MMNPAINFQHVLAELSVNRTDPCEVIRELISNSYDAGALLIRYAPIADKEGFIFFDDGEGLSRAAGVKKISPYQAFFSIGESTKTKGDGIGYKCQGSKLCFACQRFLVISRTTADSTWFFKVVENPRDTLSEQLDITPLETAMPWQDLASFLGSIGAPSRKAADAFDENFFQTKFSSGTLIAVLGFDAENFNRHFLLNGQPADSYLHNYIQFSTRHGDVRQIQPTHGFRPSAVKSIAQGLRSSKMEVFSTAGFLEIPFGFPYLNRDSKAAEADIKAPSEVSKLTDGRFYDRFAKRIKFAETSFNLIFAIDGNRRVHEKYLALDRRGGQRSGIRLADQRGCVIASSGIKICSFTAGLFSHGTMEDYRIMGDADSVAHYLFVIEGPFDLVTNRNALSPAAYKTLHDPEFLRQIKLFFDDCQTSTQSKVFSQLLKRLRREQFDDRRDQQLKQIDEAKAAMGQRERFRISPAGGTEKHLFVSPAPGEENMVGALYASLGRWVQEGNPAKHLWHNIITFSSYGIDSLAIKSGKNDLKPENLVSVEYKYALSNRGPFNHALVSVDWIVAWEVQFDSAEVIRDEYGCSGTISAIEPGLWKVSDIEDETANQHAHEVKILSLRQLIGRTFPGTAFRPVSAP